jgi:hypothetical protein
MSAPSVARRFTIAAPMPREPPVTSATLPASFLVMFVLICFLRSISFLVVRLDLSAVKGHRLRESRPCSATSLRFFPALRLLGTVPARTFSFARANVGPRH